MKKKSGLFQPGKKMSSKLNQKLYVFIDDKIKVIPNNLIHVLII